MEVLAGPETSIGLRPETPCIGTDSPRSGFARHQFFALSGNSHLGRDDYRKVLTEGSAEKGFLRFYIPHLYQNPGTGSLVLVRKILCGLLPLYESTGSTLFVGAYHLNKVAAWGKPANIKE